MKKLALKPAESLLADLVVSGIPRFEVCLVQRVEPSALTMLIPRKRIGKTPILFLGERAEELLS
ncbi:hypothetical protein ATY76_19090 [Rhizobium sp. R339]|nr:hypothetical protein ATY76_19090 [Rhizobium sp. R339]